MTRIAFEEKIVTRGKRGRGGGCDEEGGDQTRYGYSLTKQNHIHL